MITTGHPSFGVRHRDVALESADESAHSKTWPRAPFCCLNRRGVYVVTAGTFQEIRCVNTLVLGKMGFHAPQVSQTSGIQDSGSGRISFVLRHRTSA